MKTKELKEKFSTLHKKYEIFAPVRREKRLKTGYINTMSCVEFTAEIPEYSYKEAFFPSRQTMFKYKGEKFTKEGSLKREQVVLGMGLADLRALELYKRVFAEDEYFQNRIEKSVVVGFGKSPLSREALAVLPFDLFITQEEDESYKFLSRTDRGSKLAQELALEISEDIEESKKDEPFPVSDFYQQIKSNMEGDKAAKVFEDLGQKCIECGKCTMVCPTCFCFRIDDEQGFEEDEGTRKRVWDSCYYHEFSEVAGGHRFLDTTKDRIKFWYYHKFARIPNEYKMLGCVSCGRCTKTCPAGINLEENLKNIFDSSKEEGNKK
ncbi:4Fe-4S dicluster domain-containing protein [Patescibacteria group bacterium]|nr:4Fe-4S dicluster domain-containing protein [Patescibacteria group bacterium]